MNSDGPNKKHCGIPLITLDQLEIDTIINLELISLN